MDASLNVTGVRANHTDALAEVRALYMAHAGNLKTALRRLTWPGCDVEDLLQEVFVVAIRRPQVVLGAASPVKLTPHAAAGARASHAPASRQGSPAAAPACGW